MQDFNYKNDFHKGNSLKINTKNKKVKKTTKDYEDQKLKKAKIMNFPENFFSSIRIVKEQLNKRLYSMKTVYYKKHSI